MIRREIHLPGKESHWLLISQGEHARLSALLAELRLAQLGPSVPPGERATLHEQLHAAILHHDDGWATWDAAPRLDPAHHRPPSFREMQLEEVLPIWTASIEAAAGEGPFAGLTVASHFLALLESSDKESEASLGGQWQQEISARRAAWLADWQGVSPRLHTAELADEALAWLQLFDVASLWLCSACPGQDEQVLQPPENYQFASEGSHGTLFRYLDQPGRATFEPWRLDVTQLPLEAAGHIVPIRKYRTTAELNEARQPHTVRWVLSHVPT